MPRFETWSPIAFAVCAGVAALSQARLENDNRGESAAFWTVDTKPVVTIGSRSGGDAYSFTTLREVSRATDGRIVALDDGLGVIRVFDSTGKHVATYGGRGNGPGQFDMEHLQAQVVGRDTVFAYEIGRGRIQLFSVRDGLIGQRRVSPASLASRFPRGAAEPDPILMAGGEFLLLVETSRSSNPVPGAVSRPTIGAYRATRDFAELRSLGAYHGRESVSIPPLYFSPPFPAGLAYGWDPAGKRVCIGDTMAPRIQCHEKSGRSILVEWNHVPEPIADSSIQSWRAQLLQRYRLTLPPGGREILESVKLKSVKPAFTGIEVDSELNVWVRIPFRQPLGQPGHTYAVFDPTGRHLGDVGVPPMDVMEIHNDVLLGIVGGDAAGQRIVVHRLHKP